MRQFPQVANKRECFGLVFHKLLTACCPLSTFGFSRRRRSFPIGLAINDELMSPMTETIQCALTEERFIENSHPFVDGSVRRNNGRGPSVALHNQVIEVRRSLAG